MMLTPEFQDKEGAQLRSDGESGMVAKFPYFSPGALGLGDFTYSSRYLLSTFSAGGISMDGGLYVCLLVPYDRDFASAREKSPDIAIHPSCMRPVGVIIIIIIFSSFLVLFNLWQRIHPPTAFSFYFFLFVYFFFSLYFYLLGFKHDDNYFF
ncbi:hypothetical protein P170DRAFT_223326 [Aspergillus steynii IBT 23096]|uniref:Uncharacterized protein n=1 Tax=Aspergillus steynii IBT 23096 TaxID=1392250 RepID=A0A2I2G1Q0_9EURO|nr:uncharacterized protein P170DRAFT_223326 [Aspergillus steynii IBT 23096]PLB46800.1 hypothetical protein P170DRAFT_223326 [Aspergillus steynii IBT 23096]